MTATSDGKNTWGGRRAGAGRKAKDGAKPRKEPKCRGGSGKGGWRPGAGRPPGAKTRAAPSPPGQLGLFAEASAAPDAADEPPIAASAPAPGPRTPLEAMRALRRIAKRLGRDDRDARWFAECLARYELFAESGKSLDRALGLAVPGNDAWFNAERRERGDRAICELANLGIPPGEIAKKIDRRLRLGNRVSRPGASREDELLDTICLINAPTSEKQIRRIIMKFMDKFGT